LSTKKGERVGVEHSSDVEAASFDEAIIQTISWENQRGNRQSINRWLVSSHVTGIRSAAAWHRLLSRSNREVDVLSTTGVAELVKSFDLLGNESLDDFRYIQTRHFVLETTGVAELVKSFDVLGNESLDDFRYIQTRHFVLETTGVAELVKSFDVLGNESLDDFRYIQTRHFVLETTGVAELVKSFDLLGNESLDDFRYIQTRHLLFWCC
jgi:hypothetical protein